MTDEQVSITTFARKFRLEAAACLVQVVRDENASPHARTAAAERILHYSDGRPSQGKPIKIDDLSQLSDQERMDLLKALSSTFAPLELKDLVAAAVSTAIAEQEAKWLATLPHTENFVRRAPLPPPKRQQAIPPPHVHPLQEAEAARQAQQEVLPPDKVVPLRPAPTPEPARPNSVHPSVLERSKLQAAHQNDPTFYGYRRRW